MGVGGCFPGLAAMHHGRSLFLSEGFLDTDDEEEDGEGGRAALVTSCSSEILLHLKDDD